MHIIDTYCDIRQCFPHGRFDKHSWNIYAQKISPYLIDKLENDVKKYNFELDILPVLQSLIQNEQKLIIAHNSFDEVTNNLEEKIREKLGIKLNVDIIFYLGLCNSAGWATKLGTNPTVLLGVEKIVELLWYDKRNMLALIYHELGHIWHFQVRKEDTQIVSLKDKSLWQLYTEGIAMYVEQLLCEDWMFYQQDTDGWLTWCEENRSLLFKEFSWRIDNEESTQEFFGDWCNYNGKSDIGYFLGCELIKNLSKEYSLVELANLKLSEIDKKIRVLL